MCLYIFLKIRKLIYIFTYNDESAKVDKKHKLFCLTNKKTIIITKTFIYNILFISLSNLCNVTQLISYIQIFTMFNFFNLFYDIQIIAMLPSFPYPDLLYEHQVPVQSF